MPPLEDEEADIVLGGGAVGGGGGTEGGGGKTALKCGGAILETGVVGPLECGW